MSTPQTLWGQIKIAGAAGVLFGGYPFAGKFIFVGSGAPSTGYTTANIAAAITAAVSGDVIMLGPQAYQEDGLIIPSSLSNVTIIGNGNRGSCSITPITAGAEGLQVLGNNITLLNVDIITTTTADYALSLGNATTGPTGFVAHQCQFAGPTGANPACNVLIRGASNVLFNDCELSTCSNSILFQTNATGTPTRIRILDSWFRNATTVNLGVVSTLVPTILDLEVRRNMFAIGTGTTAPTDFLLLGGSTFTASNTNTGFFAGNEFATATNAAAVLTIGTGMLWGPNGTEAGWSTARPA